MYCIALAPYVSGIMQCQSERVSKCALSMYTVYALVAPHYEPTFSEGQVVQKAGIEEQECTEMHRNTCVRVYVCVHQTTTSPNVNNFQSSSECLWYV